MSLDISPSESKKPSFLRAIVDGLKSFDATPGKIILLLSILAMMVFLKFIQVYLFHDYNDKAFEDSGVSLFVYALLRRVDDASWWVLVLATLTCLYIHLCQRGVAIAKEERKLNWTAAVYVGVIIVACIVYLVAAHAQKGTFFWILHNSIEEKPYYKSIYTLQCIEGVLVMASIPLIYAFAFIGMKVRSICASDYSAKENIIRRRLLYAAATTPALIFTIVGFVTNLSLSQLNEPPAWVPEIGVENFVKAFILWYLPFFPLLIYSAKDIYISDLTVAIGLRVWVPTRKGLSDWKDIQDLN